MAKISIRVDGCVLKAIDRAARESKRTRSDVCRLALRKFLHSEREALAVWEEQMAYRAHPVTPDEFDSLIAVQTLHDLEE